MKPLNLTLLSFPKDRVGITAFLFLPFSRAERTIDEIILTSARGPYVKRIDVTKLFSQSKLPRPVRYVFLISISNENHAALLRLLDAVVR